MKATRVPSPGYSQFVLEIAMNRREFICNAVVTAPAASVVAPVLMAATTADASASNTERYASIRRPLTLDLTGNWYFQEDPNGSGEADGWFRGGKVRARTGRVPLPWQLAFDDLRTYSGTAWYERDFKVPAEFLGKRLLLVFEAVKHSAKVWVNGQYVGVHEGGQTAFQLEATNIIRNGAINTLTVRVNDPAEGMSFFMDTHSLLNVSGIWRNVWLEATGETHISHIFALPDIDSGWVDLRIGVSLPVATRPADLKLRVRLKAPDGELLEHQEPVALAVGEKSATRELRIKLNRTILWDLEAPQLYETQISIDEDGRESAGSVEFGMRKIEGRGDRVYLNNKPIYLVGGGLDPGPYGGAVDINWHLPPPYALPTDEQIQHDIRTTKSLGVNFVRVPLRPADPRFLYWADRMGLLVMQGGPWTPTEGIVGRQGLERYKEWWSETVFRDRNHPSLVLWELFNESFGINWEMFKAIAAELHDNVKELDPTRFVLDNAGGRYLNELNYWGNHGKTDIHDVHSYPGFPCSMEGANFEQRYPKDSREEWLNLRSYGKPVLITEFAPAPYIYNVDKVKRKWGGEDPWWFSARAKRVAMPAQWDHVGFEERFRHWGFEDLYGDFTKFTEASDWYYFEGLKYYTELMRINPETAGFVSWLFDSAPHPVGSIDFYKDKKVYCDELAKIWTQDLVILDNQRRNVWAGETLKADVHLSHFSQANVDDARIEWWLEGADERGVIDGIRLAPGQVRRVGEIAFRTPDPGNQRQRRLYARLVKDGRQLSLNWTELRIFPPSERVPKVRRVNFVGFDHSRFQVMGYDIPASGGRPSRASFAFDPSVQVAVASSLDSQPLVEYLKDGATVILMVCDHANYWERRPVPRMPSIEKHLKVNELELGGRFQGGHSDSFFIRPVIGKSSWRIPFRNPIAWPFYKVWPNNSIIGIKPEERNDMLAGAYGNLIRSVPMDPEGNQRWGEVSATIAQFRAGKGRLIVSTFELASPCLDDPVAAIMLNDLVAYAAGDFSPSREFLFI
jgi:hypothetical protein